MTPEQKKKLDEVVARVRNPVPGLTLVSHGFVKRVDKEGDLAMLVRMLVRYIEKDGATAPIAEKAKTYLAKHNLNKILRAEENE